VKGEQYKAPGARAPEVERCDSRSCGGALLSVDGSTKGSGKPKLVSGTFGVDLTDTRDGKALFAEATLSPQGGGSVKVRPKPPGSPQGTGQRGGVQADKAER
jgi:hypothetical protein